MLYPLIYFKAIDIFFVNFGKFWQIEFYQTTRDHILRLILNGEKKFFTLKKMVTFKTT